MMVVASENMKKYFEDIEQDTQNCYAIAKQARKKGFDPSKEVEITLAKNMAERVIGLISVVAPQIKDSGAVERIMQLEDKYGVLDWRVALTIALEIAHQKFCKFDDKKQAMEIGIRAGFAYGTVGVVSSPLEGFVSLDIKNRRDNKGEYFCMNFSGPIRNAGGTAASWSVIIADYVRKNMGYSTYDPSEEEVKRTFAEITDYHERVTNLQYFPSQEESEFLTKNLPVEISGDPTEKYDVSNHKDLPRVDTNKLRGGFCLIHSSCIPLKAAKLWKQLSKWGKDMGMDHWGFLQEFLEIKKKAHSKGGGKEKQNDEKAKITPDYTYIKDLVAGRPVLAHPLAKGGFRLRYGRSRTSGYSGQSIHPSSMHVMSNYIATGTQLKVERPGKGAAFTPCDTIDGPIVKIDDGSVIRLETEALAKQYKDRVKEVLFLGDELVNYGDFFNRAHVLIPAGYCEEWWAQELEKATVDMFGNLDVDKLEDLTKIDSSILNKIIKEPMRYKPEIKHAINLSKKINIPLHPYYTYHWKDISKEQLLVFLNWFKKANIKKEGDEILKIILPYKEEPKRVVELIGLPHITVNKEFVVIEKQHARALAATIGCYSKHQDISKIKDAECTLGMINSISEVKIRDKSGTYIGARMGRPEKAKMRKMTGSPHVLFPVGEEGGRLRSFQSALETGKITAELPIYRCKKCNKETIFQKCEICGSETQKLYFCNVCGAIETELCRDHGETRPYKKQEIDIAYYFNKCLQKLKLKVYPDLIKGVRGTSNKDHIPENLMKGIIRASHGVHVNKDGTVRYDASELTCTHFKPKEVGVSVEKLRNLGYQKDIHNKDLINNDQVLEIKPQDVILPACQISPDEPSDDVLLRTTKFIDDCLVKIYGLKPYYDIRSKSDLVGHYIIGLAPHTSAGMVGRIIGFSQSQGFLAHPYFHAAERRDTDGDEIGFMLLMDAFLNFSRSYLPTHRGSTMDAPLVLTSILTPGEVDDMAFDMDIVWKYPLELYEAALQYKMPWEIDIKLIKNVLNTTDQYEGMGFTHDSSDFNAGVLCSAYKTLPSMEEKLKGQMEIAERLRSVETSDVARLVIDKHFLKDIKGNLRKFSMQEFRCVKCNQKFRRPPLVGKCTFCGGKILFTISQGSVIKYLQPSISLANNYNVPVYVKQTLELLQRRVDGVFGKEKEKQEGLGKWFG